LKIGEEMGFLDHSTNNIIVDAVLTDIGRLRLSQNDSSFQIVKFAFGDDEVDYSIIKKFGLTVGREKIEKNTPIFEAQTHSMHALKYKLVSQSNQAAQFVPILINTADSSGLSDVQLSEDSDSIIANRSEITTSDALVVVNTNRGGTPNRASISLKQDAGGSPDLIPLDLRESVFMIKASNRFLQVLGSQNQQLPLAYLSERDQVGAYRVTASGQTGSPRCVFKLQAKPSLNETIFSTFGIGGVITTVVTVTGLLTGASHSIVVRLAYSTDTRSNAITT